MSQTASVASAPQFSRRRPFLVPFLKAVAVVVIVVWSLFPILWILLTSLKTRVDVLAGPAKLWFVPSLDAYQRALSSQGGGIATNLLNSVVVTALSTALSLVIAALAAFALSRYRFRGRGIVMNGILASRLLPPVSAVVPLFLLFSILGLIDSHLGLVLIYAALNAPFAAWLLKSFFDAIPADLEEAAMVDGCTRMGAFWRITFPLTTPGLVATGLIVGNMVWNEFMFAFMFTSVKAATLPVALGELKGAEQTAWQDIAAQSTLLILPAVIVGIWVQKYLVKGLTAGAVK